MTTTTAPMPSIFESMFKVDEGYPGIIDLRLINNRAVTTIHWVREEVPASIYAAHKRIAFCGFEIKSGTNLHIAIKDGAELPAGISVCPECALYR